MEITHTNEGTINKNSVSIRTEHGTLNLYFSYETLIGVNGKVSVNNWSNTTGKFLNELEPDKKKRIEHDEILLIAEKELRNLFLTTPEQIQQNL